MCPTLRNVLVYDSTNSANAYNSGQNHNFSSGSSQLTLEKLVLSENEITSTGAGDIAYALCYNKTIHALDLSYNRIGDEGILELLSCLQYNQVLRSIYTIYNDSDDERVDRVLEMRTAALLALENHIDRAEQRETFHNTGLSIDRTGMLDPNNNIFKQQSRSGTRSGSRGDSRGSNSPYTGTGTGTGGSDGIEIGSLPCSPTVIEGGKKDRRSSGSGKINSHSQFSTPIKATKGGTEGHTDTPLCMHQAQSPNMSPSQLADSLDSRGGLRFDLGGTIATPGSPDTYTYNDTDQGQGQGRRINTAGTSGSVDSVGTSTPTPTPNPGGLRSPMPVSMSMSIPVHTAGTSGSGSGTGTPVKSQRRGQGQSRPGSGSGWDDGTFREVHLAPVPAFNSVTLSTLTSIAKQVQYATRDNSHLAGALQVRAVYLYISISLYCVSFHLYIFTSLYRVSYAIYIYIYIDIGIANCELELLASYHLLALLIRLL